MPESNNPISSKTRSLLFSHLDAHLGKVHGLFVGVEEFQDKSIPALGFAADDAVGLWEAFGGEANPRLSYLIDEQASRKQILEILSGKMRQVEPGDLLIFFIGGHGIIEFDDFFFLPYDFEHIPNGSLMTGISATLLINAFSNLAQKGVNILMILDTCHAGAIPFDISKYTSVGGGGMSCLFSCSPLEFSHEAFFNKENGKTYGKVQSQTGNGVFTYHLIEGLNGAADPSGNGEIRLRDLFNYVYDKVKSFQAGKQHPYLNGTLNGNIVLKRSS